MRLRLASANLFSGRSPLGSGQSGPRGADQAVDTGTMARSLARLDADVLALQEVDRCQPRSGHADQAAAIAEACGLPHHRFVPLIAGTPGVSGWRPAEPLGPPPPGPSYGIALASRRPVTSWHVLPLRPPRGRWPLLLPSRPPRLLWLNEEPRAAVAAVLAEDRLVVACTHLAFVPGVNAAQLRRVRAWLAALAVDSGATPVLLGDLNLPGRLPARITGWTPLVTGPTYPAPAPRLQVDHVLAAGLPAAGAGRAVPLGFSDHLAVLAEIAGHPGPD
ncbi:MAG TPA: endonuclease/exonuclease/phosphatase family protein [Kineosporiaceae bacterium]